MWLRGVNQVLSVWWWRYRMEYLLATHSLALLPQRWDVTHKVTLQHYKRRRVHVHTKLLSTDGDQELLSGHWFSLTRYPCMLPWRLKYEVARCGWAGLHWGRLCRGRAVSKGRGGCTQPQASHLWVHLFIRSRSLMRSFFFRLLGLKVCSWWITLRSCCLVRLSCSWPLTPGHSDGPVWLHGVNSITLSTWKIKVGVTVMIPSQHGACVFILSYFFFFSRLVVILSQPDCGASWDSLLRHEGWRHVSPSRTQRC